MTRAFTAHSAGLPGPPGPDARPRLGVIFSQPPWNFVAVHESVLAQSGHCSTAVWSPLSGVKRTSQFDRAAAINDAVDGARSAASKCYRLVASKSEQFKEVRLGNDGVLKFWRNWRGHDDVMQTRSIRGSGEPAWVSASLNACLRLGPDSRRALWPAATPAAQTGRTHDRTRPMLQQHQKVLAKAAPSTHDPKPTSSPPRVQINTSVQLARRTSVSSISVTGITPGVGCSITNSDVRSHQSIICSTHFGLEL